ncbi:MAG: alpha/beta hydrolase [Phycisphaerae bacterium]|nr:alpha/beta hydrolase [Phycisphaerae bacterium]
MKTWRKITLGVVGAILVVVLTRLAVLTRSKAHDFVTQPRAARSLPHKTPADYRLPYEDVIVTTTGGLRLVGWYIPSQNGAVIIAQHGYKSNRAEMLNEAEMLHRHGYGVLISSVRAHDYSDGEQISFGCHEVQDLEAWYRYVLTRRDIDPGRIGILGNSMGGSIVIQYAAQNANIKAVVANSAFSSLKDTVATSVTYFTGLRPFPFAPLIIFWAEREVGFKASEIDAKKWIPRISPRPVFLMQGGADVVISTDSGNLLYAAAGDPKELWTEPELGHTRFDTSLPQEYEQRVVGFFDKYLVDK